MRKGAPHTPLAKAESLYSGLPNNDFSRDVLAESVADFSVMVAPAWGSTDLGTPERLLRCTQRSADDALAAAVRWAGCVPTDRLL